MVAVGVAVTVGVVVGVGIVVAVAVGVAVTVGVVVGVAVGVGVVVAVVVVVGVAVAVVVAVMKSYPIKKWGLEWYSKSKKFGVRRHLLYENYLPKMFYTRKEAVERANMEFGYIKIRKDLRAEPHGWRMPRPVKIISIEYKRLK